MTHQLCPYFRVRQNLDADCYEATQILEQCGFSDPETIEPLDAGLRRVPECYWHHNSTVEGVSVGGLMTVIDSEPGYWDAISRRAQWSRDVERHTLMYCPPGYEMPDTPGVVNPVIVVSGRPLPPESFGGYSRRQCMSLLDIGVPMRYWPTISTTPREDNVDDDVLVEEDVMEFEHYDVLQASLPVPSAALPPPSTPSNPVQPPAQTDSVLSNQHNVSSKLDAGKSVETSSKATAIQPTDTAAVKPVEKKWESHSDVKSTSSNLSKPPTPLTTKPTTATVINKPELKLTMQN